jgi:hypothetical protein
MQEDDRRKGKEESPRDGQQKLLRSLLGSDAVAGAPRDSELHLCSPAGWPMSDWSAGVTLVFPKILGDPWIHETRGQAKIELGAEIFWPDSSGTSRRSANGVFCCP